MALPFVIVGLLICAMQAVRSARLLISALWLAGASALVAVLAYLLAAPEVAVIELSVGAGLVTVLLVFAINVAGDEARHPQPLVPKPLAWALVGVAVVLLGWLNIPSLAGAARGATQQIPFAKEFWENRSLDTLLQIVLLYSGVLGVLGLLGNGSAQEEPEGTP